MNRTTTPDYIMQRIWYDGSAAYLIFLPLSWLFGMLTFIRRRLYENGMLNRVRINRPVVVIGNITVGGTGKTPVAIWLATKLTEHGMRPGIVSRGYGGRIGANPVRVTPDSDPMEVGDEAVLMAKRSRCPVVVHPNRVRAAQDLSMLGVDVIIADDGLQHYRLYRQFEIAVVDGTRGFGNRRLLPAGPLREPLSRLDTVDRILVNKSIMRSDRVVEYLPDEVPVSDFYLKGMSVRSLDEKKEVPLAKFAGKEVHAVAAIGNPARFFTFLESHGMQVIEHVFPDHANLREEDLQYDDRKAVLMTEKDAVKCRDISLKRCWYVPVEVEVEQGQAWLDDLCRRLTASRGDSADE
jgi:tetraacyldisaccharide 4'-kinase